MKLVLLQDVKNIGKKGAIVEVADGYARNFLLPKKLAAAATEGIVRSIHKEASDLEAKKTREREQAQELAQSLEGKLLSIPVRVGDNGKLFGSVTSQDVADAVKSSFGLEVEKKSIQLKEPIKTLGEHTVPLKLHPKVNAQLRLVLAASE
jgi:large subunit ribosomal protein L9